jgi:hypothetical protein
MLMCVNILGIAFFSAYFWCEILDILLISLTAEQLVTTQQQDPCQEQTCLLSLLWMRLVVACSDLLVLSLRIEANA